MLSRNSNTETLNQKSKQKSNGLEAKPENFISEYIKLSHDFHKKEESQNT